LQQTDENSWQARYHGNYGNYTIKLTLDERFNVKKYSCSCPSDYSPCKHIGFVQAEIKDSMLKFEEKNVKNEISVKTVLQDVSLEELRNFVIDKAKYNSDLTQSILLKFADKIKPLKDENIYSQIIADALLHIDYDDDDYNEYGEIEVDLSVLEEWLKKAENAEKQGKYKDAEGICKASVEEYADWALSVDFDVEECVYQDYQDDFFELLTKMANKGHIEKQSLYDWCKTEVGKQKYADTTAFNLFNNLMSNLAVVVNPSDFIASQQKILNKIADKSSPEAKIVLQRLINFYRSVNQKDKADELLENNMQIDAFRKTAVQNHIAEKRYAEAKKLLNEKLKDCDDWRKSEWKELLLAIAQKENDTPAIRKLALEFLENRFDEKYFSIYKSAFPHEGWITAFENLYARYNKPKNQWDKGFKFNISELLKAENQTERLLEYLEIHGSIDNLKHYHALFAAQFPEKTLALFKKLLNLYVDKNMGRDHYEYARDILETMRKINGGQDIVKQMIENYRTLYKNRRAMMEILNKL
jgi:hypothetical protein